MTAPAFPITTATKVSRVLEAAVARSDSPYSYASKVYDWGGRRWAYEIEAGAHVGAAGKSLSAFLAKLGGPATVFTLRDPSIKNTGAGTVTVNGAGQTGTSLVTTGWTTAPAVGDFLSIGADENARLYQVTDTTGTLPAQTLTITPALRSSPSDGASVEIAAPIVALRMRSPVPVSIAPADVYRASFSAVEAI